MSQTNVKRWRDLQHHISRAGELTEQVPWADNDSRDTVRDLLAMVNELLAIRMAYLGVEAYGEEAVLHFIQVYHDQFAHGPTIREIAEGLDYSQSHVAYLVELLRSRFKLTADEGPDGKRYAPAAAAVCAPALLRR